MRFASRFLPVIQIDNFLQGHLTDLSCGMCSPYSPSDSWEPPSTVVVEAEPTAHELQLAQDLAVCMMSGRIELVWGLANSIATEKSIEQRGAMTDASKRQRGGRSLSPSPTSTAGTASCPVVDKKVEPGTAGVKPKPQTPSSKKDLTSDWTFPPGIGDIPTWGATVLDWGKCKDKTYQEVAEDTSEGGLSYRRWLLARKDSGSPNLKDLASYLYARTCLNDLPQAPVPQIAIPGTSKPRVFRDPEISETETTSSRSRK